MTGVSGPERRREVDDFERARIEFVGELDEQ